MTKIQEKREEFSFTPQKQSDLRGGLLCSYLKIGFTGLGSKYYPLAAAPFIPISNATLLPVIEL